MYHFSVLHCVAFHRRGGVQVLSTVHLYWTTFTTVDPMSRWELCHQGSCGDALHVNCDSITVAPNIHNENRGLSILLVNSCIPSCPRFLLS